MDQKSILAAALAVAVLAAAAALLYAWGNGDSGDQNGGSESQPEDACKLIIEYVYEDGTTAAESYSAVLSPGDPYSVASPSIEGYTSNRAVISGIADGNTDAVVTYSAIRYEVVWKDSDGSVLETDAAVPYGTVPSYDGKTPSKEGYAFAGWDPAVSAVTGDAVYTATYSEASLSLDGLAIEFVSGTDGSYSITADPSSGESVLTFGAVSEDTEYSLSGTLLGSIVVDVGDGFVFTLNLSGVTIESGASVPIYVSSASEFGLSAKKGTENLIRDLRPAVGDEDTSAAVYSVCDMDLKGKGALTVISAENNGIHSKDDLTVKNLTLTVDCKDNALKGNDSVTVESGTLTLISRQGDGIKTSNTALSSKGNQKGTVRICSDEGSTDVTIYAASDGIDAAYDCVVEETEGNSVVLTVFTDSYSEYSEEITEVSGALYVRSTSGSYSYSALFTDSSGSTSWSSTSGYTVGQSAGMGRMQTYYYYELEVPSDARSMALYAYTSSQKQGQADSYAACTRQFSINSSYDTLAVSVSGSGISAQWTMRSGSGGGWGMNEGNSDKGDYSTKGMKADNSISISGGTVAISSYDDGIHANSDVTLESTGGTGEGSVTISGGTLTIRSNDDGIHADGALAMSGGTVTVTYAYEGLEGGSVTVSGGKISVTTKDDGLNSSGNIILSGGYVYVYAGGDGIDSNSSESYRGIVFCGAVVGIVSTSGGNSAIDTDRGYSYTGGTVLAICPQGMASESVNCQGFSGAGKYAVLSAPSGSALTASVGGSATISIVMPSSLSNAVAVYLGSPSATISAASSVPSGLSQAVGALYA